MVTEALNPGGIAERYLRSSNHGWSIGVRGAIGEFMYDDGEDVRLSCVDETLTARTSRGALRMRIVPETRCVAFEAPGECMGGWSQTLAFCLPADQAALAKRRTVTELGPDNDALFPGAQHEILFDLGLNTVAVQFCVRTGDPHLISVLRAGAGRNLFEPDNPLICKLTGASPTRVIISALGRVEVYQPVAERGGTPPSGPHTHLLPALLGTIPRKGEVPFPSGMTPVLSLHPEHPLYDKYGNPRPVKQDALEEFQSLLDSFGTAQYLAAKRRFLEEIANGAWRDGLRGLEDSERVAWSVARNQFPYLQAPQSGAQLISEKRTTRFATY